MYSSVLSGGSRRVALTIRGLPLRCGSDIVLAMFQNFTATDKWTKKPVHCAYQCQIVAIATRHADAVDYKFLAGGKKVWVALAASGLGRVQKAHRQDHHGFAGGRDRGALSQDGSRVGRGPGAGDVFVDCGGNAGSSGCGGGGDGSTTGLGLQELAFGDWTAESGYPHIIQLRSDHNRFLVFPKDLAHRVRDLSNCRVGFDGSDDSGHHVGS